MIEFDKEAGIDFEPREGDPSFWCVLENRNFRVVVCRSAIEDKLEQTSMSRAELSDTIKANLDILLTAAERAIRVGSIIDGCKVVLGQADLQRARLMIATDGRGYGID